MKKPSDRVMAKINDNNCIILSQYINTMTKITLLCPCGNSFTVIPNDVLKSKKVCCEKCRDGSSKDEVKNLLNKHNIIFTIVNDKFNKKVFVYNCSCGNTIRRGKNAILNKYKNPLQCNKCIAKDVASNKIQSHKNTVISFCVDNNIKLLSPYTGAKQKLLFECQCGNSFERQWNSISYYDSIRCEKCSNKLSKFESSLRSFLNSINIKYETNNRSLIAPYELDIYLPDYKTAIECNGTYFHSSLFKSPEYHLNKTEECEKLNIKLIQIVESIYLKKPDIYHSIIKSSLGLNDKIYARNCTIESVTKENERAFLNKYHLQGYIYSDKCVGLYYKGLLISLVSFGPARFNKKDKRELLRYCTTSDISVVGGFSKLIAHSDEPFFITYADRFISNGNCYKKAGLQFLYKTKPSYFYISENKIMSRMQCQKHKLKNILTKFDEHLTEEENMRMNGFYKTWNSGNLKYRYHNYENQPK